MTNKLWQTYKSYLTGVRQNERSDIPSTYRLTLTHSLPRSYSVILFGLAQQIMIGA